MQLECNLGSPNTAYNNTYRQHNNVRYKVINYTTKLNHKLLKGAQLQRQLPYVTDKYCWTKKTAKDLNWEVHQPEIQTFPHSDQTSAMSETVGNLFATYNGQPTVNIILFLIHLDKNHTIGVLS